MYRKNNKPNRSKHSDEMDFEEDQQIGELGFGYNSLQITRFTVNLDEDIKSPAYYRSVVAMLLNAGQHDHVDFNFNSNGGSAAGMITLMDAISKTAASTQANIIGDCASAASMLALSCDTCEVSEYGSMLCHTVKFGVGGKLPDVEAVVKATGDLSRRLLRETYEDFLSPSELELVLRGDELYLSAEEIRTRLEHRSQLHEAAMSAMLEPEPAPAKPKRQRK